MEHSMNIKKLRLEKGWSQEQLAEISGVSGRTIQRIEKGEKAGLESQNALAAAFGLTLSALQKKLSSYETPKERSDDRPTVYTWKGFFIHLATFMAVITWLLFIAGYFNFGYEIVMWAAYMWTTFLLIHVVKVLNLEETED